MGRTSTGGPGGYQCGSTPRGERRPSLCGEVSGRRYFGVLRTQVREIMGRTNAAERGTARRFPSGSGADNLAPRPPGPLPPQDTVRVGGRETGKAGVKNDRPVCVRVFHPAPRNGYTAASLPLFAGGSPVAASITVIRCQIVPSSFRRHFFPSPSSPKLAY